MIEYIICPGNPSCVDIFYDNKLIVCENNSLIQKVQLRKIQQPEYYPRNNNDKFSFHITERITYE